MQRDCNLRTNHVRSIMFKFSNKSFIEKITDDEYNNLPMLRSTDLKEFCKSPAHYKYARANRKQSSAFDFGHLVHAMMLEPETVKDRFHFVDVKTRTTKEYMGARDRIKDKIVMLSMEMDMAKEMADNAMADPSIHELITSGYGEIAAGTKLGEVWCSAKADCLIPDRGLIVDIKTTSESAYWFKSVVRKYQYDLSAAFYLDVFNSASMESEIGYNFTDFVLIAMEKSAPYLSRIFVFDQGYLADARTRYQSALTKFKRCLDTNTFPGYNNEHPEILSLSRTIETINESEV
jgi:hypothetical protein